MIIVEYNDVGKILSVISYPVSDQAVPEIPLYQGRLFLPQGYLIDWERHYVKDGDIADRDVSPVYLDGDKLHNVREGATVTIDGVPYLADGSVITLEFSHSGTYQLKVEDWPYLDWVTQYEN